jgi:hypothetical protein
MFCGLLLENLTIPALGDDLHRIVLSCGLVESMSECLSNDGMSLSMSCYQIFCVGTGKARLCKINLKEEHDKFLDWFGPSGE